MKKVFLFIMMCLMAFSICVVTGCSRDDGEEASGDYVDLGLSSHTKWKSVNEVNPADAEYDFFTYEEAMAQFGEKLPSQLECKELVNECEWIWMGTGYKVVGPNGNSIMMPAAGWRESDGTVRGVGASGWYWSATPYYSEDAWVIYFSSPFVDMGYISRNDGNSVRLVQD